MIYRPSCLALLLCSALASAQAADAPAAVPSAQRTGDQTRAWLDLQRGGTEALGEARPMSGDVADAVYQRYLDSFKQPIAGKFSSSGSTAGGTGNAGTSASAEAAR